MKAGPFFSYLSVFPWSLMQIIFFSKRVNWYKMPNDFDLRLKAILKIKAIYVELMT